MTTFDELKKNINFLLEVELCSGNFQGELVTYLIFLRKTLSVERNLCWSLTLDLHGEHHPKTTKISFPTVSQMCPDEKNTHTHKKKQQLQNTV